MKRPVLLAFISVVIFFLAALYITYPLFFHMGDRITGFGDELIIVWIQNWVIHALTTHPLSLFQANIYYPYHNTLAFSETFIVTSILAMPIRMITGEPITTVNFTLFSSLILLAFSVYLLCFYLTKHFFVSLFSGFLMPFSPAYLEYYGHLHVLSFEFVPLSILFFLHFMKSQQSRHLGMSLLFLLLQVYNSVMPGYFIVFSFVILLLYNFLANKKKTLKLLTISNSLVCVVALLLMLPLALPYYSVSQQFRYVRNIKDAVHSAIQPEDLLYPGRATRLQYALINAFPTNRHSQNSEFKPAYLGVVFTFLAIYATWYMVKNRRKNNVFINAFAMISLTGFIVSLGPVLHLARHTIHKPFLIPLPYAVLYYILPGFQGFRASGRWNMLFVLGLVVVIALVLQRTLVKQALRVQIVIFTLLFLGVITEYNFPMPLEPVPQKKDFPKVYTWLQTTPPDSVIIELPIYVWNMTYAINEYHREYYATAHFRKMVNGATGFSPEPWQALVRTIEANFPSTETIQTLQELGVKYVIIHTDDYDALHTLSARQKKPIYSGWEVIEKVKHNPLLKLVKTFKDTYVFSYR